MGIDDLEVVSYADFFAPTANAVVRHGINLSVSQADIHRANYVDDHQLHIDAGTLTEEALGAMADLERENMYQAELDAWHNGERDDDRSSQLGLRALTKWTRTELDVIEVAHRRTRLLDSDEVGSGLVDVVFVSDTPHEEGFEVKNRVGLIIPRGAYEIETPAYSAHENANLYASVSETLDGNPIPSDQELFSSHWSYYFMRIETEGGDRWINRPDVSQPVDI